MGRPRAFDRDVALERAMEVFWSKGYESSSISDLLAAMGIQRFSMYATFGNKQALFLAALELYRRRWGALISDHVSAGARAGAPARTTLVELLRTMGRQAMTDSLGRGCLIANSAVELRYLDSRSAAIVRGSVVALEATFTRLLARAIADGELAAGPGAPALARFLIAAINGIRDVAKAGGDRARIHDLVETLISTALPESR